MALFKKSTKKELELQAGKSMQKKKIEHIHVPNAQPIGAKIGSAFRILLKPIMSEKATVLESHHSYAFRVTPHAKKEEIKRAIFQVYGVMPTGVHTLHVQGKHVRFGAYAGKRPDWKKAIVTLKKGESIHIHEGI